MEDSEFTKLARLIQAAWPFRHETKNARQVIWWAINQFRYLERASY